MSHVARTFVVSGRVQGVGYRYFAQKAALALQLKGWVRNLPDGSVECLAVGTPAALRELEEKLHHGPMMARVDAVYSTDSNLGDSIIGFQIR